MSRFDPPLSRSSAALFVVAAIVVFAWVLYAAHAASTMKTRLPTVGSSEGGSPAMNVGARP